MWVGIENRSGGNRIEINQSQMDFLENGYHTLRKKILKQKLGFFLEKKTLATICDWLPAPF